MASLRFRGVDILRPTPASALAPLETSCFPLVPYCNRLRDGKFAWGGRSFALPLNFLPEHNTLHGFGWQYSWDMKRISPSEAQLDWAQTDEELWPSTFDARQQVRLDPEGCTLILRAINSGKAAMPVGVGLHPYFRRRPETQVRFDAGGLMINDDETMPTGEETSAGRFGDFSRGGKLPSETIDNCYRAWGGRAEIEDDLGTIVMTAKGAPHLHLYAPEDGSALCLEPVSHTPDALNRAPQEMTEIAPGQAAVIEMRIEASLAAG